MVKPPCADEVSIKTTVSPGQWNLYWGHPQLASDSHGCTHLWDSPVEITKVYQTKPQGVSPNVTQGVNLNIMMVGLLIRKLWLLKMVIDEQNWGLYTWQDQSPGQAVQLLSASCPKSLFCLISFSTFMNVHLCLFFFGILHWKLS